MMAPTVEGREAVGTPPATPCRQTPWLDRRGDYRVSFGKHFVEPRRLAATQAAMAREFTPLIVHAIPGNLLAKLFLELPATARTSAGLIDGPCRCRRRRMPERKPRKRDGEKCSARNPTNPNRPPSSKRWKKCVAAAARA